MDLSWGCTAGRPARPGPTAARHPAPAQSACAPRESAGRESDLVGSDCCDRWMSVRDLLAVPSLGLRLLTAPDAMLRRNVAPRYAPRPNDGCSSSQRGSSTRWADGSTDEVQTRQVIRLRADLRTHHQRSRRQPDQEPRPTTAPRSPDLGVPPYQAIPLQGLEGLSEHLLATPSARRRSLLHRCGPSTSATSTSRPHLLMTWSSTTRLGHPAGKIPSGNTSLSALTCENNLHASTSLTRGTLVGEVQRRSSRWQVL